MTTSKHQGICSVKECLWNGREHPKDDLLSQSESIEWEKDSWCVSVVAEAMTFARTEPIGKDASHITRKLRERVSQAITTAVAKRESDIANQVQVIKLPVPNPYGKLVKVERVNMLLDKVLQIIKK